MAKLFYTTTKESGTSFAFQMSHYINATPKRGLSLVCIFTSRTWLLISTFNCASLLERPYYQVRPLKIAMNFTSRWTQKSPYNSTHFWPLRKEAMVFLHKGNARCRNRNENKSHFRGQPFFGEMRRREAAFRGNGRRDH